MKTFYIKLNSRTKLCNLKGNNIGKCEYVSRNIYVPKNGNFKIIS